MSKYNKGDKFEIEIKEVLSNCEEAEVDWTKVPVDTPILVKNIKGDAWYKKYFAEYKNGRVYAWDGGGTSWSSVTHTPWEYAKLAEVGE